MVWATARARREGDKIRESVRTALDRLPNEVKVPFSNVSMRDRVRFILQTRLTLPRKG